MGKPIHEECEAHDDMSGHRFCRISIIFLFWIFSFNSLVTNLILQILQQNPNQGDQGGITIVRKE